MPTDPSKTPPAPDPAGHGVTAAPPAAPADKNIDYLVFEATEVDEQGLPVTLKRIADVTAENGMEARWLAADTDKKLLARTTPKAEGDPPLLLPLAKRLVKPTPTREREVITTKRS